jgi:hypothetical protein
MIAPSCSFSLLSRKTARIECSYSFNNPTMLCGVDGDLGVIGPETLYSSIMEESL